MPARWSLPDAVEFFNLVLELKLTSKEKEDLVAYMLCLYTSQNFAGLEALWAVVRCDRQLQCGR